MKWKFIALVIKNLEFESLPTKTTSMRKRRGDKEEEVGQSEKEIHLNFWDP